MKNEIKDKIREIMGDVCCPKNYICAASGFALMCKSKKFGNNLFLDCLEPDPTGCSFAYPLEGSRLCQCPLRKYIKEKLNH